MISLKMQTPRLLFIVNMTLSCSCVLQVVVLTGTDPYYSAGANLSENIKPMHPRKLHAMIAEGNERIFNLFLDFPKPILVASNGPAIGATVTSAALCDGILASERATYLTPFTRLAVCPEGCAREDCALILYN